MSTPRMSDHARQRCEEMGISTKVVKRIVQHQTCSYPSASHYPGERRLVSSDLYPEYLVVVQAGDPEEVVTVLLKSEENLCRAEANERARKLAEGR